MTEISPRRPIAVQTETERRNSRAYKFILLVVVLFTLSVFYRACFGEPI